MDYGDLSDDFVYGWIWTGEQQRVPFICSLVFDYVMDCRFQKRVGYKMVFHGSIVGIICPDHRSPKDCAGFKLQL